MSDIKGVDPSVSSTPPTLTDQLKEQNPNRIPKTAQGGAIVDEFLTGSDEVEIHPSPVLPTDVKNLIRRGVTESFQDLMRNVLVLIDASIPNKDQNRALKKCVQKEFDSAFVNILNDIDPYGANRVVAASVLGNVASDPK